MKFTSKKRCTWFDNSRVKRNSRGQSVVCSEIAKSKTKGRVIASALAVAVAGLMSTVTAQAAATVGDSGTYSAVLLDVVAQGGAYPDSTIGAVAIGSNLKYTDAYGRQASTEATAPLSIAIGVGATARAVDGVPADSTNPDDPNFAQPLAAIAVGTSATANGYTSTAIGYRSSATDRSAVAFGAQANAENFMATALGSGATSTGFTSTSVGANAEATGRNAVSVGTSRHTDGLVASGEQGILLGASDIEGLTAEQLQGVRYADGASPWSSFDGSNLSEPAKATGESRTAIVSGKNALGVGVAVKATGERAIAEGYYASASGTDSVAFGSNANATQTNAMALGTNTVVTAENSTALGGLNTIKTANTFAFGSNITTSIGDDVILGTDSASYESGTATAGRADYPSYTIKGDTYAFAGTQPHNIISVGATGKEGRIQNVAAGLISATSTDAINGSQLYAVTQSLEELAAKPDLDTNTDKSVRVNGSELVTVTNTTGAADGITTMTDYTVSVTKGEFTSVSSTGALTAPTTNGVATVGDVVTAVNSGYWTANVGGTKLADVKFGDTLNFVDGNGTKAVIKNGGVAYDINVKSSDNSIITKPNTDGSVDLTVNSSMIPSTVVDAGKGVTVTPVTDGNKTTYTVAVDDTIADKQYVADEIAKIPVITDTNTDKSVRVNGSDLVTVTNTTGAADGITTMTDYTISLSDKVATKDFVADEIAKIPTVVDTNTISEVAQGDGITVNAATEGDKTTYTVALDDATKAQLTKEESVVAKAGETNIVVTQPRTNGTDGKEYEISLAKDLTGIDSIGKDGSKFTFNGDSISAGNVNITDVKSPVNATDAANKQYVDDAIANIPSILDTNTDKSVRVASDSELLTVTSKAGTADGITTMTDYTISLSDKVATTDYVDGEIAKIPTVKAGDNIAVKQDTVNGKPVVVVSADKSTVSQGDGITVSVTETPTANGAVNRDYKVSLDDATKGTLAKVEKGINTKAEDGKVINHQLGDTISVVGDAKNITTATTEDGAISVKMSDDIKVNSVSINNTAITMGGNGIHAGDMKVTGVAPGAISPSSTDAVNGSQLFATNVAIADNRRMINELGDQVNNRMDNMQDEYRAGIADAAAIAGLPEIHLTGKSMIAVAGSTFKGESALAVGFSSLSDNSRIKFKATGSVNTQGDFLGTVGAGWAF